MLIKKLLLLLLKVILIFKLAQINFKKLGLKNIEIINSSFDQILSGINNKFDLIFFDGNHSKEATLKYFKWV